MTDAAPEPEARTLVLIEDNRTLGPWFYLPHPRLPHWPNLATMCLIPIEQLRQWESAEHAWARAQREMREHIRRRETEIALAGRQAVTLT